MQDVKDEGPASGMTRDEVIETNERLRAVRIRLEDSYDTAKKSLVTLMNQYGDSKTHKNMFNRYPLLKLMIKVNIYNIIVLILNYKLFKRLAGCYQIGNRVLDPGRYPEAGETGNGSLVRDASLFDNGEDPEVGRRCENGGSTGRGDVRAQGSNGAPGK